MNPLLLIMALSLSGDLETGNLARYEADNVYTYSGRTASIEWCHPELAATFDLEILDIVGDFVEVSETGLVGTGYLWNIPRTGSYIIRLRAHYPDGGVSEWNESVTNGSVVASGCDRKRSFILNAIIAPPTGGGGFENE